MMIVDITWLTYIFALVVFYYAFLFLMSWLPLQGYKLRNSEAYRPFFIIVVPAHNEELVIEATLKNLLKLKSDHFLVMVVNDGSMDQTSTLARQFEDTGKVLVIDRDSSVAGQGKGEVLNYAYRLICKEVGLQNDLPTSLGEMIPLGTTPNDIIVGVLDADGQLDSNSLQTVAPYFADSEVGAIQLPVRIWNYKNSLLTRLQDMEFVGFSLFVQAGRDLLGSVGLGGNGQFIHLAALYSLGDSPWSKCLTEDLEIGLRLIQKSWKVRFCRESFVAQQGLSNWGALLGQRTRWIQGHYTCWKHLPLLWRKRSVKLHTAIDITLYLGLVVFVLLVGLNALLSLLSVSGVIIIENNALAFTLSPSLYWAFFLLLSLGPLSLFLITYLRFAKRRLNLWYAPAILMLFALYTYLWVPCSLKALWNITTGQKRWIKTPREPVSYIGENIRS